MTRSEPMRAATSKTSAPWSIPTRSTRKSTSSPGRTMPGIGRSIRPAARGGGAEAGVTTCCAAARPGAVHDRAIPGPPAARRPDRCEWGCDRQTPPRTGACRPVRPSVTSRRRRRGVSVAFFGHRTAGPDRVGQARRRRCARGSRTARSQGGEHRAVRSGHSDRDRDHPTYVRIGGRAKPCGDGQLGRDRWQLADHTGGRRPDAPGSANPPPPGHRRR